MRVLDTHKEIMHLKELGFDEKKAEGIVQLYIKNGESLVTKNDLKVEIDRLETTTKADLLVVKTEISRLEDIMKFDRALLLGIFFMMLASLLKTLL